MRARRAGSVRFEPYYKVQFYNARQLAWQDVQRTFATPAEALAAVKSGAVVPPPQCNDAHRLMYITEKGRVPLSG